MAFDPVKMKKVLNSFGNSVVATAKENLNKPNRFSGKPTTTSGNLESKIKFVAKVMPNSMSLKFDLGEYGQGIDQGINGAENGNNWGYPFSFKKTVPSRGMVDNIMTWMQQKGISGFNPNNPRTDAFQLASMTLRRGITATRFFEKAYIEHFKNLDKELVEAFGLDVDDFFEFIFKK